MAKELPAGFRLGGREFVPQTLPRMVQNTIDLLEKHPSGELLTTRQLADALGVTLGSFSQNRAHPALADNRRYVTHGGRRLLVWGSKQTIQKLDEECK